MGGSKEGENSTLEGGEIIQREAGLGEERQIRFLW